MSFSDEDLRRAKVNARLMRKKHELWKHMKMGDFFALITRLEAAEKIIECAIDCHEMSPDLFIVKAWLKACGK